jgi:hypothetical protein
VKNWKARHFVLRHGMLRYSSSKGGAVKGEVRASMLHLCCAAVAMGAVVSAATLLSWPCFRAPTV